MDSSENVATDPLRIGGLADAAGVGTETIRYYQRRGLLGRPPKPDGGQRAYPPAYVQRVRFIKRAQALGFSLDEIAALLALDSGTGHARARLLATQRLAQIETRIAGLAAMRAALADLIDRCAHSAGRVSCPIITTLASAQPSARAGSPAAGAQSGKRARAARGREPEHRPH
jgi:MerR family mercuric resistance operon transcriptional regulator